MSILRFSALFLTVSVVVFSICFWVLKNKKKALEIILILLRPVIKVFSAVYNGFVWFFF